jgi:sulfate transport system permease protein
MLRARTVLPGLRLSLTLTLVATVLIVLLPLSGLVTKAATASGAEFWAAVSSSRAVASYALSIGASLAAAALATPVGLLIAWVLVRYRFRGRALVDAIVDLPFALPTAVAGLALTALYSESGWLGRPLAGAGIKVAYSRIGIVVALVFLGLPFMVRSVQPVLEDLERDVEEAAAVLGASRLTTLRRVIFPAILPAALTGFAMAFARGIGEYGSIVFISGNVPMRTEITPLLIVTRLEQFDYAGATALATVMLAFSLTLLLGVNLLQKRASARLGQVR